MNKTILVNNELRKKIAIFGALSSDEIVEILKYVEKREYKKEDKIFLQNSSPESIYILESGEIELIHETSNGRYSLKKYEVGDCFGQIALLGILPNLGDCISKSDTTLLELSKFSFHRLSKENSKLFTKLLLNITREICRYNNYITNKFIEKLEGSVV